MKPSPSLPGASAATLALLLALSPAPAAEAASRASFRVSASITQGCLVNHEAPSSGSQLGSLGSLDFGQHPATSRARLSAHLAASPGISLNCTPGVALRMTVDGGRHLAGGLRHLGSGKARLAYRLYSDAALSQEIAVGGSLRIDVDSPGNVRLPLHAALQLPGNQAAGHYQDQLGVTLSW